jgi:hypothetical protein
LDSSIDVCAVEIYADGDLGLRLDRGNAYHRFVSVRMDEGARTVWDTFFVREKST